MAEPGPRSPTRRARPRQRCGAPHSLPRMHGAIRIIGIDPGLRRTGWGVVESLGSRLSFVAAGTIRPQRDGAARRAALRHP